MGILYHICHKDAKRGSCPGTPRIDIPLCLSLSSSRLALDDFTKVWDQHIAASALAHVNALIEQWVKPDALVLDAGAGIGERTLDLLEYSALEILRQRYARGEIDTATFEQMRVQLEAPGVRDEQPSAARR